MNKKIANILSSIILVVLLLAVGVFVAPRAFGITPMVVLSGSMEPSYPVGSLIFTQKINPDTLKVGDNITFTLGNTNTVVTHRVIENDMELKQLFTKGDANKSLDASPVNYSNVMGKAYKLALPLMGFIGVFINSAAGYITLGALFVALLILTFIADKGKKKGGTQNETQK